MAQNNANNSSNHNTDYYTGYEQRPSRPSSVHSLNARIFEDVKRRIDAGEKLYPSTLGVASIHQAKIVHDYEKAIYLYNLLKRGIRDAEQRMNRVHPNDIKSFQKTISTLVRYAPSSQQAQDLFYEFFADWDEPFRTMSTELVLYTNLIHVVSKAGFGTEAEMRDALKLVELTLSMGVLAIEPENYIDPFDEKFRRSAQDFTSLEIYKSVCSKVLRYFGLDIGPDKMSLVRKRDVFTSQRRPF